MRTTDFFGVWEEEGGVEVEETEKETFRQAKRQNDRQVGSPTAFGKGRFS